MSLELKYQPMSLNDIVFPDAISERTIAHFVATGASSVPGNLLLEGPYGTGKSAVARLLVEQLLGVNYGFNSLFLSGTEFKTAGQIAAKITNFASTYAFGSPYRIVVIDELDFMAPIAQADLRVQMTKHQSMVSYIFTTNTINNVDGALISRCRVQHFGYAKPMLWMKRAEMILAKEGVTVKPSDLLMVLNGSRGDVRTIYRNLEVIIASAKPMSPPPFTTSVQVIPFPGASLINAASQDNNHPDHETTEERVLRVAKIQRGEK